jgi:ethanolamine utilization microcompartment shell protein EutL
MITKLLKQLGAGPCARAGFWICFAVGVIFGFMIIMISTPIGIMMTFADSALKWLTCHIRRFKGTKTSHFVMPSQLRKRSVAQ